MSTVERTALSRLENLSLEDAEQPVEAVNKGKDNLYPKIRKLTDLVYKIKKTFPDTTIVQLTGTVKLHGTHADLVFDPISDYIRLQSRNQLDLRPKQDNCGFAAFVHATKKDTLFNLRDITLEKYRRLNPDMEILGEVVVAGEWCGTGVQKKVAICNLPKFFAIISIKVSGKFWCRTAIMGGND